MDVRMLATMCVDMGEMTYKLQSADAVLQQELAAQQYVGLLMCAVGSETQHTPSWAHAFTKGHHQRQSIQNDQRDEAIRLWAYSLYLHAFG